MSLLAKEIATVQALLKLQGSKIPFPPSEMDIADILAAKALLNLRATCNQVPSENSDNQIINVQSVNIRNQTDVIPGGKSESLSHRTPLKGIQNMSKPVKTEMPNIEDNEELEISTGPSTVVASKGRRSTMERRRKRCRRVRTSTPELSNRRRTSNSQSKNKCGNNMVRLGEGYAMVPKGVLANIKWESYKSATRKLLIAVFPREVLATHSMSGKRSPAFPNKPAKAKLDPNVISDIIKTVMAKCGVAENIVRMTITTKCADESKMMRYRQRQEEEED
ncbi:early boundary activity protein 1-like [Pieris napi]|uniref:early boundary activity protein 1-like n=1 Tax=Pieris napi TaxID=78633 RepID=UPI001FB92E44|nr:early boundary activity protein 1-like [Pieris napi]